MVGYQYMLSKNFVVAFFSVLLLLPSFCLYADSNVEPKTVKVKLQSVIQLNKSLINNVTLGDKYLGVLTYLKTNGEWVTLKAFNKTNKIHITTYLLEKGYEALAVELVKKHDIDGWLTYKFQSGVANDFMFAVDEGYIKYLDALFTYQPIGLNTEFSINQKGDTVLPLALLATKKYNNNTFYTGVITSMILHGANPHQKMLNGLSSMMIASASNNTQFIRLVQVAIAKNGSKETLFDNTPLSQTETIEMQAIVDSWIEKNTENNIHYDYKKLHAFWIKMILKGYNIAADLVYDELVKLKGFSVDSRVDNALSGLMAASMSEVYGGNVEYAKLLISRGANVHVIISVNTTKKIKLNLIQLALQKDNYKVVALLIKMGTSFVSPPDDNDTLILSEAMQQKAFKSAYLLKEALIYVTKEK